MIDKLTKWISVIFLFLLPVYFTPLINIPSETDKQIIVILFACILFGLSVIKIIQEKKFTFVRTPVDILLILLTLTYAVSNYLYSPNKMGAFTSPLGTGTFIALTILFFTLTQIAVDIFPWILSSAVVSLLTFAVQFRLIPAENPLSGLLTVFPLLLIGSIYLGVDLAVSKKSARKNLLRIVPFVIILAGLLFTGFHLATDQRPLFLPFNVGWIIMMEMFKNFGNFLVGVGPANFPVAYSLAKPAALNQTPFWNFIPSSSSSFLLTLATEVGIIGSMIYVLISKASFKFSQSPHYQTHSKPYLISLFAALILQIIMPTNIILLTLTIILLSIAAPKWKAKEFATPKVAMYIGLAILLGIFYLIFVQSKVYLASIYFRQSIKTVNEKNLGNAYKYALMAINSDPTNDSYYNLSSNLAMSLAQNMSKDKEATDSAKNIAYLTQQAVNDARTATAINGLNAQNWGLLASVAQNLIGSVQGADQITLDAYNKQIMLDPNNPMAKLSAGSLMMSAGQLDQAQNLFVQAVNLKPDWNSAHYNLAVVLAQSKKYKDSATEMQRVLDLTPKDSEDYKKVAKELEQIKALIPPESTPSAGAKNPIPSVKPTQPVSPNP